jgi:omega-6 fatty acid desaturase (delta-12 desaturase)
MSKQEDAGEAGIDQFDQRLLARFMRRRLILPTLIFAFSLLIYGACIAGAILASGLAAKILYAVLAGVFIANLGIIGHDAVHRSFTASRWLNRAIGTMAFLPALHPYGRWEHHHNRVHHRYTAQIGVDNAYSPMTVEQYRAASRGRRLYYRFMRSLTGQPFFYMIDIWLPKMFLPSASEARSFRQSDFIDLTIVYAWLVSFVVGLAYLSRAHFGLTQSMSAAFWNAAVFGFLIPFLVWNLFISFVTIVQHTGPNVRWVLPTGRPSTHEEKLCGTVHLRFPEFLDWFFHRVMQHVAHHVNPMVPLYTLKGAEKVVIAEDEERAVIERWTPLYHWRLARDCKLYDPERGAWCDFNFQLTGRRAPAAVAASALAGLHHAGTSQPR